MAEVSRLYPEVSIHIVNGTHEELYDLLRFGGADLVLTDQRRAFSDKYANFQLLKCGCYAELSVRSPLAEQESVTMEELKRQACILISSREQQNTEEDYLCLQSHGDLCQIYPGCRHWHLFFFLYNTLPYFIPPECP